MKDIGNMQKRYWLDEPRNHRRISWWLFGICIIVLLSDFAYTKKSTFAWEDWFGFYAFFGFVACFGLVIAAKEMRKLVKRDEDYYDL